MSSDNIRTHRNTRLVSRKQKLSIGAVLALTIAVGVVVAARFLSVGEALTRRDTGRIALLYRLGTDVCAPHAVGQNVEPQLPLACAVDAGDLAMAQTLLQAGCSTNQTDRNGWTALMSAANRGDTAMASFLLEHGADVNAHTTGGTTVLMVACTRGKANVAAQLLRHNPDLTRQDRFGHTALDGVRSALRLPSNRNNAALRDVEK